MSIVEWVRDAAKANPGQAGYVYGERRKTWKDVENEIAHVAGGLLEMGLRPGDKIGLLAMSSDLVASMTMGASWAGIVVVPVNVRLSPYEMAEVIADAGVQAFMFDKFFMGLADTVAPGVDRRISLLDEPVNQAVSFGDLVRAAPVPAYEWRPDEMVALIYTGGTTGKPKGVIQTVRSLSVNGAAVQRSLNYDSSTTLLQTMAPFHIAGFNMQYGVTRAGGTHVFISELSPSAIYGEIARNNVNALSLAPTVISMLLDYPDRDERLLENIRWLNYGASPISEGRLCCKDWRQSEVGCRSAPIRQLLRNGG